MFCSSVENICQQWNLRFLVSRIELFPSVFTEISNAPQQLLSSQWFYLSGSSGKRRELSCFYSPPIMHPQRYHARWHLKDFHLLLHVLSVICHCKPAPRGETLLFFYLQEHSQMIPLGPPTDFSHWSPHFELRQRRRGNHVYVCVCACQDSVLKCHGKRFMSLGGLVLNPSGMIEGSLNSDRFSIIRTQRGRLRRTEKEQEEDRERR